MPRAGRGPSAYRLSRWLVILAALLPSAACADEPLSIREFRSQHFFLHTDLSEMKAQACLKRMEGVLARVAKYWGREPKGIVTCYLMDDLARWKNARLPHRFAVLVVHGAGGVTLLQTNNAKPSAQRRATIYASSKLGVAEHEVVHAYCVQAFGKGGPDWYKEGMAELASTQSLGRCGVECSRDMLRVLRSTKQPSLNDIVAESKFTGHLGDGFTRKVAYFGGGSSQVPIKLWSEKDARCVQRIRDNYRWSWALCHMMHHNPNYAAKFRQLGHGFLTTDLSFKDVFAGEQGQIQFEFNRYLKHVATGYRADLCAWDWTKRFRQLGSRSKTAIRIAAARGFQASGVHVTKGQVYRYVSTGTWQLAKGQKPIDATGRGGQGRLIGKVFHNFELSRAIPLGTKGFFIAPATGKLYLRCQDAHHALADNSGSIVVKLSR